MGLTLLLKKEIDEDKKRDRRKLVAAIYRYVT